ncbi:MAG: LamB/YcsF family protein [Bacteroidales bacterium]|nr:LamB/YcsF family protein [Bacteroidales bacterium]MDT8372359.1 LamB/YcsF family protein [Bacteroidales bacterium]
MNIDINCDLSEMSLADGPGNDKAIMPFISSVNIACGFHAGDPLTIEQTLRSAIRNGVSIGAHPGYPDRENFGRKPMTMSPREMRAMLLYQAGAVKAMAETARTRVSPRYGREIKSFSGKRQWKWHSISLLIMTGR